MPLSPPAANRQHLHTRRVTCQGFRRADGLWDIEGHITDTKTYGFTNSSRGTIEPGDFVHQMWVRLTLDDRMTVVAVEAVTDHAPFSLCGDITPNFQRLVGLRVVSGWTAAVKERLGGREGCTHLVELLGPVATTAFQTMAPILWKERAERQKSGQENSSQESSSKPMKPPQIDQCHAFASDGPVVQRMFPDLYTGQA